jgi:hypothetical protein
MRTLIAIACALGLSGCGGSTATREPDEYTGCGADEQWRAFDDQEPQATVADVTAPSLTMPAAGATVPYATRVKLTWQQDPNDPGQPDGDVPYMGPGCNMCCPQFNPGGLSTLHLPPISGDAYDLQFSVGGRVVWRVVTTLQEWSPDPKHDAWPVLRGHAVSLRIWRMNLLRNDVKQGPYVATQPFAFTVGS